MAELGRGRGQGALLSSHAELGLISQLLDELELVQGEGGKILDWHTCDMFPERWIDLVVVLRCDHALLWTRLEKR